MNRRGPVPSRTVAPDVAIATLRLRVPASDVAAGRRIGRAVAEQLAARADELGNASAERMHVRVDAQGSKVPDTIARSIVDRIVARRRGGGT